MRKLLIVSLLVLVLSALLVSGAFAWDRVIGTVVDGYGNGWTHGGTIDCVQPATGISTGSGTLGPDGSFEVFIGNGPRLICTIDPAPGPDGDPGPITCEVPTDPNFQPLPWDCGPLSTGTGPNAIVLNGLGASTPSALPMLVTVAGLAALAGAGLFLWRRKQTTA